MNVKISLIISINDQLVDLDKKELSDFSLFQNFPTFSNPLLWE